MKTKPKAKKDEKKTPPLVLPPAAITKIEPTKYASLLKTWSGKWQDKSTVAYRVTLPSIEETDTMQYLESLRDAFLLFLKKAAATQRNEVWFGGLSVSVHENTLTLSTAFCPFSERAFVPRAKLFLDENGAIQGITPHRKTK